MWLSCLHDTFSKVPSEIWSYKYKEFKLKIFNLLIQYIKLQAFLFYWTNFSLLNLSYKFNNVNQQ